MHLHTRMYALLEFMQKLMFDVALLLVHTFISFVLAKPLKSIPDRMSSESICPLCAIGIIMKNVNDM